MEQAHAQAAVVAAAPLVEPVEIGICRFFAGAAAFLVDDADCEAAPPSTLPERNVPGIV